MSDGPFKDPNAEEELVNRIVQVTQGGSQKYHDKNKKEKKLFVRDRLKMLFDDGFTIEDGLFANLLAGDLPADGVVTAMGKVNGQTVIATVIEISMMKRYLWSMLLMNDNTLFVDILSASLLHVYALLSSQCPDGRGCTADSSADNYCFRYGRQYLQLYPECCIS